MLEIGHPKDVVNHYIALLSTDENDVLVEETELVEHDDDFIKDSSKKELIHRHGNKLAIIKNVKIVDLQDLEITKIETGNIFKIVVCLEAQANLSDLVVGISIRNLIGLVMYGTNTNLLDTKLPKVNEGQQLKLNFQIPCHLNKGVYTVTLGVHSEQGVSYDWIDELIVFEVNNTIYCDGVVDLKSILNLSSEI